jgi:hypothetical protein
VLSVIVHFSVDVVHLQISPAMLEKELHRLVVDLDETIRVQVRQQLECVFLDCTLEI